MVVWGATPIVTKVAVAEMAPLAVGLLRTALAGAFTLLLLLGRGIGPPRRGAQLGLLAVVTGGSLVAFPILFTLGVGRTSAAHAGLILAALPLPLGLTGALLERALPSPAWWLGAAVALAGAALLIGFGGQGDGRGATVAGDLLVAGGTLGAAVGHASGARLTGSFGTWPTALWAITLGGAVSAAVLPWSGAGVEGAGAGAWAAVVFLAGGSTVLAFAAWYWSLSSGGIARIGALQFLQPLVTLGLAWLILSEPLDAGLLAATLLILAGVALTQRGRAAVKR